MSLLCSGRAASKVSPLFLPSTTSRPAAFIPGISLTGPLGGCCRASFPGLEDRAERDRPSLSLTAAHSIEQPCKSQSEADGVCACPLQRRVKPTSLLWAPLGASEMPLPHHYLWDAQNPPVRITMWLKPCPLKRLLLKEGSL